MKHVKLKNLMLAVMTSALLLLTSCGGKEPEQKHLEYENAISTFVSSFNKGDEQTMLSCFTQGAKERFADTESSASAMLDENIRGSCGEYLSLTYMVSDKTELSEEEIDNIKSAYNSEYGMRLNIKKAYSLTADFSVLGLGVSQSPTAQITIITLKTDNGWCIYGDVITKIF